MKEHEGTGHPTNERISAIALEVGQCLRVNDGIRLLESHSQTIGHHLLLSRIEQLRRRVDRVFLKVGLDPDTWGEE